MAKPNGKAPDEIAVPSKSEFSVMSVPAESIDYVFQRVLPQIEKGLRHGAGDSSTPEHIREALHRGDMFAWVVLDTEVLAMVVLSVRTHAAKTVLFVEMAAGRDMDKWVGRIEELLREYRDLIGADTIEATCRDGMAERLTRWRRKATIMELS